MKRILSLLAAAAALGLPGTALAVGTAAGTEISNQATVQYDVGTSSASENSNIDTITVDELIDVSVVSQNASNVAVNSPASDRVLTFEVTNVGNGVEDFELFVSNVTGDQFDVTGLELYQDTNSNGVYDAGTDTLFTPGTDQDLLNLDANGTDNATIFVVADIPSSLNDGDLADVQLQAKSLTARTNTLTTAGDSAAGQGDSGTDAIVASSVGEDSDQGTYVVTTVSVSMTKSSAVDNDLQANEPNDDPIPGATVTYTLTLTVNGNGTADNVVIEDPIPAGTTYVASSMTLDSGGGAVAQTDASDGDEGTFDATGNGTVSFSLGSISPGGTPNTYTMTFQVTID